MTHPCFMSSRARRSKASRRQDADQFSIPALQQHTPALRYATLVFALLTTIVLAYILTQRPVTDSDFWHHLAYGRTIVEEGRLPETDELSHTAEGRPWVSSGWLPTVLLYKAYTAYPDWGPMILVVRGVVMLTALALFFYGWHHTKNPALACTVILLALAASYPRFLPRPDLFSQAYIVALIMLLVWYEHAPLSRDTSGILRAVILPLLFFAWANCHMLFVIGLAVAGLFTLWVIIQWKSNRRPDGPIICAAMLASIAACCLSPNGFRDTAWFIIENARLNDTALRINELKPSWTLLTEPGGAITFPLFCTWLAFAGWLAWHQRRDWHWWRWAVMALLVALALIQRRQTSLAAFGISVLVLSGPATAPYLPAIFRSRYAVAIPVSLFLTLSTARLTGNLPPLPAGRVSTATDCHWFPCEAISFLRENPPPGGFFHDLYSGGFLAYHLAPQTKVFIDGRLEVYNNGTYDDFFAPPEGRATLADILSRYEVRSVLLDWRLAADQPGHSAAILSDNPAWRLCWFSDHYALFVKQGPSTADYISAHAYRYLNPLRPDAFMQALADPARSAEARADAGRAMRDNPASELARKASGFALGAAQN